MSSIETALSAAPARNHADPVTRLPLRIDGASVAFVDFHLYGSVAIVTHTEVDRLHQGKGVGTLVARLALQHFHDEKLGVVPVCGFFLQQIRRQPEFAELLTPHCRRIFGV